MAIKGKGRSKTRQPARAPRRAPVPVPTPFVQRRWVQRTTFFVLGLLAMSAFVWLMNGLRTQDADEAASDAASTKRTAAQAYKNAVEDAIATVGVVNPGASPTVFAEMGATLQTLTKGKSSENAADVLSAAKEGAAAAAKAISDYDVGSTISGQGFVTPETFAFVNSSEGIVQALLLYQRAAQAAAIAARATGNQTEALAGVAQDLYDDAQNALTLAWATYTEALRAGGVADQVQDGGLVPELPGGGT